MEEKSFFIKTFGCQMNIRDSEIMAQKLGEHGYIESGSIEDASVVILNTCSVRAKAEQKVFSLLGSLRKVKKSNPGMKICVAGCVAQQEGQNILERMPHVDLVIGTQAIYDLPLLLQNMQGKTAINLSDAYEIPRYIPRLNSQEPKSAVIGNDTAVFSRFVTIMQGCNNFCTYCVVPYTRGREVSRRVIDILDEVKTLVDSGVPEIVLLGQNVNSYGRSNPVAAGGLPYSFARLLHEVAAIDGLKRLRFTTSNPKDLSDELINCFASITNLCPQFHLPVQSGSDSILKRMNRKYTIRTYLDKVERLIEVRPDIAITTDMIIGFPGETEQDFRETMDLLDKVRFHGSFSFKYSDRPGTKAAALDGKVDEQVKSERLQVFQKRQDEISLARNTAYIGRSLSVLLESVQVNLARGRTGTNHIVHVQLKEAAKPGHFIKAHIYHAGQHSLKATQVL
ncbi:MAG: tRNA (N6-isopentenyl adenosine(37)-C2)-methylthiotransferase MiaB [Desulfofustis sp.]|nr:tRNA (N6-isopentenyl adenosine(37)-C2)-methylthiotransferase MiaB [Desulfofustis sp.]